MDWDIRIYPEGRDNVFIFIQGRSTRQNQTLKLSAFLQV